mmetsp:Transcript_9011/g.36808  ORF Transcript_9011/g.36808 Transcript_9011/m.36808 type:complete len:284 (-) Transcript_9011:619-1470(-)
MHRLWPARPPLPPSGTLALSGGVCKLEVLLGDSLFDPVESLCEGLHGRRVADAQRPLTSEGISWHQRDARLLQQVAAERVTVADGPEAPLDPLSALAHEGGHRRHHVEGSIRHHRELHAAHRAQAIAHVIAPRAELLHHCSHLVTARVAQRQRGHARLLTDAARSRSELALDGSCTLGERRRRGEVAQPPAGHGESLREAIDGDCSLVHARVGRKGVVRGRLVHDVFVDLVGDHQQAWVASDHFRERRKLLGGVHATGGIAWCAQDEQPAGGRQRRLERLGGQ